MKKQILGYGLLLCLVIFTAGNAFAATKEAEGNLIIGTKQSPPFAIKQADGSWEGLSIELWRSIAEDLGLSYEFREMSLPELLDGVAEHKLTAAVAALTVTGEREKRMDFSHPFYTTGLGIAINKESSGSWTDLFSAIISPAFVKVLLSLSALLLICGLLVWFFERRANPEEFGGRSIDGIGAGFWWAAVTMTTVGYGDKSPRTLGGRLVAMVWMFAGIIVISSFTAAITSALTLSNLNSLVKGPKDLAKVKVASVGNSTSGNYLQRQGISFQTLTDPAEGLKALAAGQVDAVVYDAPILKYLIHQTYSNELNMLPGTFERQDYAIALAPGSPLREEINRALLAKLAEPWWQEAIHRYMGP